MTSKAQRNAGWLLPSPITGYDTVCVSLRIPNAREYRAAFIGAIGELAKWWNWEKSYTLGDNRASQAAQYMLDHIKDMQFTDCCEIQYRYTDCDILEFSLDGENWQVVANFGNCFVALHPATNTRNQILPVGGALYPIVLGALSGPHWKGYPGLSGELTVDLAGHGGLAIQRYINSFSGAVQWITGGRYFDATRFDIAYPFGNATKGVVMRDDGKIGLATDTPLARLHAKQSSTERGLIVEMPGSANYNALEIRKSDGSPVSGIDKRGELFLSTVDAIPTHEPDHIGTTIWDTLTAGEWHYVETLGAIPVWVRDWNQYDGTVLQSVITGSANPGEPGNASLDFDNRELTIIFPGEMTPTNAPRIYHDARPRPSPGESDSVILALDAGSKQMLPWELRNGDLLTVSDFTGWVSLDSSEIINQGYSGSGFDYHTNNPSPSAGGDFLLPDEPPMSLIMAQSLDMLPYLKRIGISALLVGENITDVDASNPYANFYLNRKSDGFMVGLTEVGNIQFKVELLAGLEAVGCGFIDFSNGMQGWSLKFGNDAPIIPGGGQARNKTGGIFSGQFLSTTECYDPVNTPEYCEDAVIIQAFIGQTVTGRPRILYTVDATASPYSVDLLVYFRDNGVWQGLAIQMPDDPTNDWTMPGSPKIFDAITIYLYAHPTLHQNGSFAIQGIEIICE